MSKHQRFSIALVLLVVVSLACSLGSIQREVINTPVPVTTEAVNSLEDAIKNAQDQVTSNQSVKLEINESQLTSLVAFELQKQEEYPISNPQVYLQEGQIQMVGKLTYRNIKVTSKVVLTPEVDINGVIHLHVDSINLGPFPIPENMASDLERNLEINFNDQIKSMLPDTRIESIMVQDGVMTITGQPD